MSVDVYQVTPEEEIRLWTTCEDNGDSAHLAEGQGQGQEEVGIRKVDIDCHHPQLDPWVLLPTPM